MDAGDYITSLTEVINENELKLTTTRNAKMLILVRKDRVIGTSRMHGTGPLSALLKCKSKECCNDVLLKDSCCNRDVWDIAAEMLMSRLQSVNVDCPFAPINWQLDCSLYSADSRITSIADGSTAQLALCVHYSSELKFYMGDRSR